MYMPGDLPKLPRAFFNNMGEMSLREIAYVVAAGDGSIDHSLAVLDSATHLYGVHILAQGRDLRYSHS